MKWKRYEKFRFRDQDGRKKWIKKENSCKHIETDVLIDVANPNILLLF